MHRSPIQVLNTIDDEQIRSMIETAAEVGARRALADLGLHDDNAGKDVSELRSLLDAWRSAKKAAWDTMVRVFTGAILAALAVGLYIKGTK